MELANPKLNAYFSFLSKKLKSSGTSIWSAFAILKSVVVVGLVRG